MSPARYDEYVLAKDRVRYVGDEVAAVAAVDEETAERAVQLIKDGTFGTPDRIGTMTVNSGGSSSWTVPADAAPGTVFPYFCIFHGAPGGGRARPGRVPHRPEVTGSIPGPPSRQESVNLFM